MDDDFDHHLIMASGTLPFQSFPINKPFQRVVSHPKSLRHAPLLINRISVGNLPGDWIQSVKLSVKMGEP